ncbi:hypothetical protein RN001_009855 [Aquatica leii]|uniref:BRCT domain-containing protein n=1 Tax=Aquatica leii TaxID=1421715 RepID=A0AAN7SFU0_9COLE|nr:hypothetical protein RN001_009855 [Aquatica leii]
MMPVNSASETSKPSSSNYLKFNLKPTTKSNVKRSSDETLFETLMNDPVKKDFLLRLLSNEKENIRKYKDVQRNNITPTSKNKRLHCESPSALLRRKVLAKNTDQQSSPLDTGTPPSTPIPFHRLLEGIVAFIEIRSKGMDRSAGAKTLMVSMGAKVAERLERGVTHVVFKDGSFTTYQKAKLLKAHLVSVLWLEAVRKSNNRVPEKYYPALGIESYDVNMSEIFDEYESVVKEEYRRSLAMSSQHNSLQLQKKGRLTSLPSELALNRQTGNSFTPRRMSDVVPSSQEYELESIISYRSIPSSKTNSDINGVDAETSDDDSERGLINGNSISQLKESILCDLESQINQYQERVNESNQNILESLSKESIEHNQSQNDILVNNDHSVSTSSSRSASLLSRKISVISDISLTNNLSNTEVMGKKQSVKRKSLELRDDSTSDSPRKKVRLSELVLSNDSTKSCVSYISPVTPNVQITENSERLPPLRVSEETASNESRSRLRNSLRLSNTILQSGNNRPQSNRKKALIGKKLSLSDKSTDNSEITSTLTILSNDACNGNDSNGIRKSSRLSMHGNQLKGSKSDLEQSSVSINSVSKIGNLRVLLTDCRSDPEMNRFCTKSEDIVVSRHLTQLSECSVKLVPFSNIDLMIDNNTISGNKHVPLASKLITSNNDNEISSELTAIPLENNVCKSSDATKLNSAPRDDNIRTTRRSSRFTKATGEPATSLELTDESVPSHLTDSLGTKSTSIHNRTSQASHNYASSTGKKSTKRKLSFTSSSPDLLTSLNKPKNILEKPLKTNKKSASFCGSGNSDNMSSLRISTTNSSKSENLSGNLKTSRMSKSEVFQVKDSVKNLRRSLRRSTIGGSASKNSETMSSLRVSTDTLSNAENARVTRKSSSKDEIKALSQNVDKDVTNKSKKVLKRKVFRKLYNLHQTIDNTKELSNVNDEVEPLPIPVGSNAKTLIVPLIRLLGNVPNSLKRKKFGVETNTNKKIPSSKKTMPRLTETEVNANSNETSSALNDSSQIQLGTVSSNLSLPQTQLVTQGSRRSTLEFIERPMPKKKVQSLKKIKKSIVCTRLHKPELQAFTTAVKNLGHFYIEDEVTENTTHLIVGESKRTINILKAISRGCWILTKQWLFKSIEVGKWVDEEDYELVDFSPAVKQCRTERQAFGDLYSMDIFNDCGSIYITRHSRPTRSDLTELIKLCKGSVVKNKDDAKIIVGDWVGQDGVKCVTEKWVLDSITSNRMKSLKKYLIRNRS